MVAIAPGGYIYQKTCAQVTHYRNASKWRDPIPHIDKKGAARSEETIVEIVSHSKAKWFDHGLQSLTYQSYLEKRLLAFINKQK